PDGPAAARGVSAGSNSTGRNTPTWEATAAARGPAAPRDSRPSRVSSRRRRSNGWRERARDGGMDGFLRTMVRVEEGRLGAGPVAGVAVCGAPGPAKYHYGLRALARQP